jgi:hypothetical protein
MFQEFTAREYLKIDVANNYGLDKLTWFERIRWFDKHEHQLDELLASADEPALFYAGVKAYRDVLAGKPIGYMISLDATSSGLQLLAALTGDRGASQLCNVVDTGTREDAYDGIYRHMLTTIQDTAKVSRNMAKDAVMTSLYGSKAVPKKVFGEGKLLDIFFRTMQQKAPGAWELNEAFLALWNPHAFSHDWVLPDNFHVQIKVMDQVRDIVHFQNQPYEVFYNVNTPTDIGRSLGANTIHSIDGMIVREITRRCDYSPRIINRLNKWLNDGPPKSGWGMETSSTKDQMVMLLWQHFKDSRYLSARILDYLNPGNLGHVRTSVISDLIASLPEKPFKVISIHDCFRCLPNYANDLRKQYNNQLFEIANSNLLAFLIAQILQKPLGRVQIAPLDPTLPMDIKDTNYALS